MIRTRFVAWFTIAVTLCFATIGSIASADTITGTVKGPEGKPFKAAFIRAQHAQTRITTIVLSDRQGQYRVEDLPAGEYLVRATATGHKDDVRNGVQVAAGKSQTLDFSLAPGTVQWGDLNTYQLRQLLPKTEAHDLSHNDRFFTSCNQSCHSMQKTMVPFERDKGAWADRVRYMRDVLTVNVRDEAIEDYATYMATAFGAGTKPASPAGLPAYKGLVREPGDDALDIVYVEYEFRGSKGLGPWSAFGDNEGMFWIPYHVRGNEVVRLDPNTGELTRFPLAFTETAGIHSAYPSNDGFVWFTEERMGRVGRLDPRTGEIKEYQNVIPDGRRPSAHTVRKDERGRVWTTGGPVISRLDPETGKFTHFEVGGTYGLFPGKDGDMWFTVFEEVDGAIVRISKDDVVTWFRPPTDGKHQRLEVDKDGIVWFSERRGNKIGRFDPATETFKEYDLPGPEASPYAIGLDRNGMVWYASHEQDLLGRLNPATGKVTEYPFPHSEISMREFFLDDKGHIWYGSTANDLIGYFIPPQD